MPTPKRLLFLVGLTRSGTSLLYALLNQHPEIALMYEADAVVLDNEPLGPAQFGRMDFWNGVLRRHGLTSGKLHGISTARGFFELFAREQEASICGEKSPSYCAHLLRLARRFPDARFLIIRRDFADIYRSVLDAARETPWWGRPGAFHRLVREQEVMVRDLHRLRDAGTAVQVVDYAGLIRDPAATMRSVTAFLEVEFCPQLVTLHGADLSAVHVGPEHSHLQRREIEPRPNRTPIPASRARTIARFQARWDALEGRAPRGDAAPIGRLAFLWHQGLGAMVVQFRYLVRVVYEIAPPAVLRAYRKLRHDLRELPRGVTTRQIALELGSVALFIAVCALIDYGTGPDFTIAPFYFLPVIFATRRLNVAAGLLASILTAIVWSAVNLTGDTFWSNVALLSWNSVMRSLQLALFALLVGADPGFESPDWETKAREGAP